jgi:hypothetical protein
MRSKKETVIIDMKKKGFSLNEYFFNSLNVTIKSIMNKEAVLINAKTKNRRK